MTKVLITGTFDIIHPGHLHLINQAKKLGDFLTVVIARDQNVVKIKGREPFYNEHQRLANLQLLALADSVILGGLDDPYEVIRKEEPDIIALGYDQQVFVNGLIEFRNNSAAHFKIERLEAFKEDICKGKNIRKAIEDSQAGFLLINKEGDWTSHDVVAKLRSILKIKQIGHTGTLDPFATGLLICAVGNATKMVGLFDLLPKTYQATIKLGQTSDTFDRTGEISKFQNPISPALPGQAKEISNSNLQEILSSFLGKQEQLPPMYSAKKINGKKLYDLARQGIEVARKLCEIEIYSIKLLNFNSDLLKIEVQCSAGTYIRVLAHDFGQKLGTGALLQELKRTAIGGFNLSSAVSLNTLTSQNFSGQQIAPLPALELINRQYLGR
ncbi:MAG: tRNA pseudouridine(55) synthase TruB [Candidatus Komeilibacteria bacterium]|nr:tRNA pseudouridine(55) synthase TruB [Candidatus Komeilibacteria bacterium]